VWSVADPQHMSFKLTPADDVRCNGAFSLSDRRVVIMGPGQDDTTSIQCWDLPTRTRIWSSVYQSLLRFLGMTESDNNDNNNNNNNSHTPPFLCGF
jgi:hypothetical protein